MIVPSENINFLQFTKKLFTGGGSNLLQRGHKPSSSKKASMTYMKYTDLSTIYYC